MDANRQRFWLLADAAHWPWLEHVDHRPGCRALHLASERSLGATADDAAAARLQEHVKATIAPYKYPRSVVFTEALPKTQTGKIQRFRLREPG